jgi:hypothetical protein
MIPIQQQPIEKTFDIAPCSLEPLQKQAQQQYLGMVFIVEADQIRYHRLFEDILNEFLQANINYPRNVTSAYILLANESASNSSSRTTNGGVSLSTIGEQWVTFS